MTRLLLSVALLLAGTSVFAQGFNYSFIQAGYLDGEVEDIDGDGYALSGSLAFTDNFFGIASYSNVEPDGFGRFEVTQKSLGIGFNTAISNSLDLVLSGSWVEGEVDLGRFGSYDDDGYGVRAGFRAWLMPDLEFNGGIEYVDFGDGDDTGFGLGLLYNITSNFAVGVSGSWSDDPDSSTLGINARLYFGL